MSRKGHYVSRVEGDTFEALSAKLLADLRNHVRFMADYPVLSDDWIQMADQVMRIGEITEMERQLPKAKDATLWECEEVALRYLLEDGKLNLCLRNLVDFNDYLKRVIERGSLTDATSHILEKFEKGMGVTLKNAWLHAEAVQTTDIPLLIQYIDDVLSYSLDNPTYIAEKKITNAQEVSVIHFLFGLLKQLENIDESRIMPLLVERRIFAHLAMHLSALGARLPAEDMSAGIECLALICSSEDFQCHTEQYIDSKEAEVALLTLKDDFLDHATEDIDTRKRLRPLLDAISQVRRHRK